MIRFIDLRGQVFLESDCPYFTFFDTVTDTFCTFAGTHAWSSIEDLESDMKAEEGFVDLPQEQRAAAMWMNEELQRIWESDGRPREDWKLRYLNLIPDDYFKAKP